MMVFFSFVLVADYNLTRKLAHVPYLFLSMYQPIY